MPEATDIIKTITAHCDTLSAGDKEGWLALWSQDAVLEDPVGVDTYRSKDALRDEFWQFVSDLSPMKLWLEREVIVCGNEAIAILQGVVTREGALQHVGPLVDHFTFDDTGSITMMRAFWKYK